MTEKQRIDYNRYLDKESIRMTKRSRLIAIFMVVVIAGVFVLILKN